MSWGHQEVCIFTQWESFEALLWLQTLKRSHGRQTKLPASCRVNTPPGYSWFLWRTHRHTHTHLICLVTTNTALLSAALRLLQNTEKTRWLWVCWEVLSITALSVTSQLYLEGRNLMGSSFFKLLFVRESIHSYPSHSGIWPRGHWHEHAEHNTVFIGISLKTTQPERSAGLFGWVLV